MRAPFKGEIENFHKSLASLSEIAVFAVLGLTIHLSDLGPASVWLDGLLIATLLAFVIRPLVVAPLLAPVRLRLGERIFVAWGGLKGAVPILLGILVLLDGVSGAPRVYGIIFVVVAFSVVVQGSTMPYLARRLGVPMRAVVPTPWDVSIRLKTEPRTIRRYNVTAGSRALGKPISELPLGERSWISMVIRGGEPAQPRGSTLLQPGDELLVLSEPDDGAEARAPVRGPPVKALFLGLALLHPGPSLHGLHVTNGSSPFQGDRRLLTTVSPNGDRFRAAAIVSFRLDRPATVRMDAVRTDTIRSDRPSTQIVWSTVKRLRAGANRLVWRPARSTPPRTYILRLTVSGRGGVTRYGFYQPSAHAASTHRSCAFRGSMRVPSAPHGHGTGSPRGFAREPTRGPHLGLLLPARSARASSILHERKRDDAVVGVSLEKPAEHPPPRPLRPRRRLAERPLLPEATAHDGRVGYAPFILRPRASASRVAVVLPTNTWQAYNFADANGDGWGDSWYVSRRDPRRRPRPPVPRLRRPVPVPRLRPNFIALARTGRASRSTSSPTTTSSASRAATRWRRAYDLVVFPGHEEYVTQHAYDVVERYRDLGGNLMFLSANNFFWQVRRSGRAWCACGGGATSAGPRRRSSGRSTSRRTTASTRRRHGPRRGDGAVGVRGTGLRTARSSARRTGSRSTPGRRRPRRGRRCWRRSRT